jgi:heme/copper-type cytochrome/quinol oxidase subunit 2
MSSSDQENKQRNRAIAENEAKREMVSNVRVSTWTIAATIVVGVIAFGIVWAWFHR